MNDLETKKKVYRDLIDAASKMGGDDLRSRYSGKSSDEPTQADPKDEVCPACLGAGCPECGDDGGAKTHIES